MEALFFLIFSHHWNLPVCKIFSKYVTFCQFGWFAGVKMSRQKAPQIVSVLLAIKDGIYPQ